MIARTHAPAPEASPVTAAYWDAVAEAWTGTDRAWRSVSDAVNLALLDRWLPADPGGRVLKTDLFDEFTGHGLVPWLRAAFGEVAGVDVAPSLVRQVGARFPGLDARVADIRRLPHGAATFDAIVSNSTLDHLDTTADIAAAVDELHRVLRPGGHLLITLDNPVNPVVRLRNALPRRLRQSTRLVPYAIGATLGPRALRRLLAGRGFVVLRSGAVFHSHRLLVVLTGHLVDRRGEHARRRFLRLWTACEALGHLPTRYLTGYFVAVLARRQ